MSSLIRTRWAAIGAALAVTLGAGGLSVANAVVSSGERAVFVPITPCRILDTRPAENVPGRQTPLGAGQTLTQNAHGNNGNCTGIPTDATGLSLNVTTTNATSATFLTIWPNGPTRPNASSLNPRPNQPPIPNAVVTDISPTGQFNIFNLNGTVDILIDINGYFVDHNHDDRYYTKTQSDALFTPKPSGDIQINIYGLRPATQGSAWGISSVWERPSGNEECLIAPFDLPAGKRVVGVDFNYRAPAPGTIEVRIVGTTTLAGTLDPLLLETQDKNFGNTFGDFGSEFVPIPNNVFGADDRQFSVLFCSDDDIELWALSLNVFDF